MKGEKIFSTKEVEGMERPAVLVIVPTPTGNMSYRAYSWGRIENVQVFDLVDGNRVELHGKDPVFVLHVAPHGFTFELDGTCRELVKEEPRIVLQ